MGGVNKFYHTDIKKYAKGIVTLKNYKSNGVLVYFGY